MRKGIVNVIIFCGVGLAFIGCPNDHITKVGLQPFDNFELFLIDTISTTIEETYGVHTYILEPKDLPSETYINTKSPRYRADKLIKILKEEKADTLDYIMGLTNKDISFTKRDQYGNIKKPEDKYSDWGIFGLGYRPGSSCIISTYRLKNTSETKFIDRVKKISLHELGHNFGLEHCDSKFCLMRDAVETIRTIDLVKPELCEVCRNKIKRSFTKSL